jgi:osmoprotectant transport system permease protein
MDLLNAFKSAIDYIRANPSDFTGALQTHLKLSIFAILIGLALCFPLGVLASRSRYVSLYALNIVGVVRSVPSVAILFLAYPYIGIGFKPALLALAALACPPILINTNVGFRTVDPAIREAAYGMGMTTLQTLRQVEFPLALPVVVAGLRTATVEVIASATLATFIGAGGLGDFISQGLTQLDTGRMMVGALPVAALTLVAELSLGGVERFTRKAAA